MAFSHLELVDVTEPLRSFLGLMAAGADECSPGCAGLCRAWCGNCTRAENRITGNHNRQEAAKQDEHVLFSGRRVS
jgi:hypothetical protein